VIDLVKIFPTPNFTIKQNLVVVSLLRDCAVIPKMFGGQFIFRHSLFRQFWVLIPELLA